MGPCLGCTSIVYLYHRSCGHSSGLRACVQLTSLTSRTGLISLPGLVPRAACVVDILISLRPRPSSGVSLLLRTVGARARPGVAAHVTSRRSSRISICHLACHGPCRHVSRSESTTTLAVRKIPIRDFRNERDRRTCRDSVIRTATGRPV